MKKITNVEFARILIDKAHPLDDPSAEYADLMDEAACRILWLVDQLAEWESAADNANGAITPDELRNFIASCSIL